MRSAASASGRIASNSAMTSSTSRFRAEPAIASGCFPGIEDPGFQMYAISASSRLGMITFRRGCASHRYGDRWRRFGSRQDSIGARRVHESPRCCLAPRFLGARLAPSRHGDAIVSQVHLECRRLVLSSKARSNTAAAVSSGTRFRRNVGPSRPEDVSIAGNIEYDIGRVHGSQWRLRSFGVKNGSDIDVPMLVAPLRARRPRCRRARFRRGAFPQHLRESLCALSHQRPQLAQQVAELSARAQQAQM